MTGPGCIRLAIRRNCLYPELLRQSEVTMASEAQPPARTNADDLGCTDY